MEGEEGRMGAVEEVCRIVKKLVDLYNVVGRG